MEEKKIDCVPKSEMKNHKGNVSKDNEWYVYDEEEGEVEDPDEEYGKRGYTPDDIVRVLQSYKCQVRLIDINENMFLTTTLTTKEMDRKLLSFCGMVYDNHLYYCNEQSFVKSLSEKTKAKDTSKSFQTNVHEKEKNMKTRKHMKLWKLWICFIITNKILKRTIPSELLKPKMGVSLASYMMLML